MLLLTIYCICHPLLFPINDRTVVSLNLLPSLESIITSKELHTVPIQFNCWSHFQTNKMSIIQLYLCRIDLVISPFTENACNRCSVFLNSHRTHLLLELDYVSAIFVVFCVERYSILLFQFSIEDN